MVGAQVNTPKADIKPAFNQIRCGLHAGGSDRRCQGCARKLTLIKFVQGPMRRRRVLSFTLNRMSRTTQKLTVLVADDHPTNLRAAVRILQALGHGGVIVKDGEQALAALAKQRFDLVLLDVVMPGLDGVAVLRRIRQNETPAPAHLPVLMVTGADSPDEREALRQQGAHGVLGKPISEDQVRQALVQLRLM